MRVIISIALLLASATPAHADDSCSQAYWSAKRVEDLQACRTSAEGGTAEAQFGYALVLWSGHDRPAQPREAIEWFRKAARQGHLLSRVTLGRFLSAEETAPALRSKVEGYAWWVAAGEKDAAASLKHTLSAGELAQAEQMAQEFMAAYGSSR